MGIDNARFRILKKVLDSGFSTERDIVGMTAEDMIGFCRAISEVAEVLELQKAVKEHRLITYLTGKDKEDKTNGAAPADIL